MHRFAEAMRAAGLEPPPSIIADGKIHRFKVGSDRGTNQSGWYSLHDDGSFNGVFGCWKDNISGKWSAASGNDYSEKERAEIRAKMNEQARKREQEEAERSAAAKKRAGEIWKKTTEAVSHPYLRAKGVKAHGARIHRETLVIPVRDINGEIHGLQFISIGEKKFLKDGAKKGHYFSIGKPNGVICIAEGFATGASIHECTGHAVAVAFDAGNMANVATVLRGKFPEIRIIICADNDESKTGEIKGRKAASACNGEFVMSPTVGKDFNDIHMEEGKEAVKIILK